MKISELKKGDFSSCPKMVVFMSATLMTEVLKSMNVISMMM